MNPVMKSWIQTVFFFQSLSSVSNELVGQNQIILCSNHKSAGRCALFSRAENVLKPTSSWSRCWCSFRQQHLRPVLSDNQWREWSGTRNPPGLQCTACSCEELSLSCHLQGGHRNAEKKLLFHLQLFMGVNCERYIPTYRGPLILSCLIFPGERPVLAP